MLLLLLAHAEAQEFGCVACPSHAVVEPCRNDNNNNNNSSLLTH